MTYVATSYTPKGVYSVHVEAESWEEAERMCEARGLVLEGRLGCLAHDEETATLLIEALAYAETRQRDTHVLQ